MTRRIRFPLLLAAVGLVALACGKDVSVNAQSTIEVDPNIRQYESERPEPIQLTVRNTGQDLDLNVTSILLEYEPVTDEERNDPDGPAFKLVGVEGLPVAIGPYSDSIDNEFRFSVVTKAYSDCTPRSAKLTIVNDNTQEPATQNYTITFSTNPKPFLTLPAVVDFGQVKAGDNPTKDIVLTNTGTCELVVDWFSFDGDPGYKVEVQGGEYASDQSTENYAVEPVIRIAPDSSVRWKASYTPVAGEPARSRVIVHSSDPAAVEGKKQVELTANSSGPCIRVEPNPVEFGGKMITSPAAIDVTIKSCGTAPLDVTGIAFQEGSHPNFTLNFDEMGGAAPSAAAPVSIPVNQTAKFRVIYRPTVQNPSDPVTNEILKDLATIVVTNNSFNGELEVLASGFGVLVECPQPIIVIEEGEEVKPQTTMHLHGEQSQGSAGPITQYAWDVKQPADNKFGFVPSNTFANPTHVPNVAGEYTYCLDVCDSSRCSYDAECRTTACKKVTVIPDEAIHCELTWNTPGDLTQDEGPNAGADMDLHFAHPFAQGPDLDGDGAPDPWFDIPYDTFWFNARPDIESMNPNAKDDPRLDRDDTDGWGPENVNLDVPVDGRVYHVGVHYWDDNSTGYSHPRVKCYIWGNLVFDWNLEDSGTKMYRCDFWDVATITWPSGAVTKSQRPDGSAKITSGYVNPAFVQIGGGSCE